MEITNLTFIVTDDCNFNCSYCMQKKEKKYIDKTTIKKAVDFFYPYFNDTPAVAFYGGEPLMAFDKVEYTVQLLEEKNKSHTGGEPKKINYFLTTNGSLVTPEIADFFNRHQFGLMLSFDGIAQNEGRKKDSTGQVLEAMKQLQAHSNIDLQLNSVFTPATITSMTESMRFIIENNGPETVLNIDSMAEWNQADKETLRIELKRLCDYLLAHHKETGALPVNNFKATETLVEADTLNEKNKRGIFRCTAGQDRMAVTPEGKLWGCYLFHDYFKVREDNKDFQDYDFGTLDHFIANKEDLFPRLAAKYSELRQDLFQLEKKKPAEKGEDEENDFCFLCTYVEGCVVCPVNAAYSTESMGVISCTSCELKKIMRDAQGYFQRQFRARQA
jgi:sulfatase maturation enzyme AslB (radical SAM superfamily)